MRLKPWTTFSREPDGAFALLAPEGDHQVNVTDLATSDTGQTDFSIAANQSVVNLSLGASLSGPRVVTISPNDQATGVARVTSINLDFSRPLNPMTLLNGGVQLLNASNQPVTASLTLNLANQSATLLPSATLDPATQFHVVLSTNITDTTGRPLEGQTRFTFTTVAQSTRDSAAQLIVYEPGATNVDPNIIADIPAYTPGADPSVVVVHGTPGAADPEVPVIVVNEGSGETTTVLSKPDGSFSTEVAGQAQDFISATFVNLNGTRVYVPVNRQLFDDGSVGLYPQGGVLTAQGENGPVQITVPPNAISDRTKFKLEPMNTNQLVTALAGVTPDNAMVAGGALHLHVEGQPPKLPLQASFPVDLATLGYPTNEPASNAVIALTVVRDTQDVTTFEILDQMLFSKEARQTAASFGGLQQRQTEGGGSQLAGFIYTASGFIPGGIGLLTPLVYDWIIVPTMELGRRPVSVVGQAFYTRVGDANLGQSTLSKQVLSGTYVVLRQRFGPDIGFPGRLQPGWVYATTGADGRYRTIAPFAGIDYVLSATHPQFQDIESAVVSDLIHTGGAVKNFVFKNAITNQLVPQVTIANVPHYPAAGQPCQVQVNASQPLGGPPTVGVHIKSVSMTSLLTHAVETNVQYDLQPAGTTATGNSTVWTGTLNVDKPVRAILNVIVIGAHGNPKPMDYAIDFVGPPPAPTNHVISPPDTNDMHGPLVVSTQPSESGFVDESGTIQIFFESPIDSYVRDHIGGIVLSGSGTLVAPTVRLSTDQRLLTLQYPGLEPGQTYTLTLSGQSVHDLAGKPLDQRPSTPAADSFSMTFRTTPVVVTDLPALGNGRGSVISGNRLYVLDQSSQGNFLTAYDISDPSQPQSLSQTPLLGAPRDLIVIPQFSYVTSLHSPVSKSDLVVVVGGDLDTVVQDNGGGQAPFVRGRGQYLWVFDMANPAAPRNLASPIISYRIGSAVTKIRWAPPNLVYEEFGSDIQQLGFVDLQELLIGYGSTRGQQDTFPVGGRPGTDLNGDGDYVDKDEALPIPDGAPPEFYGKHLGLVLEHTTQKILDFSINGGTVGVTLKGGIELDEQGQPAGRTLPPAYRTLVFKGQLLDLNSPTNGAFAFDLSAYPRWVTVLNSLEVSSNNVPLILPAVALVSLAPDKDGEQKLAVIDISLPLQPRLVNTIPVSDDLLGGAMQSVSLESDGLLHLAGSQNVVLLDPARLLTTDIPDGQLHPAIAGWIPVAGGITRSLGTTDYGVYAVADRGRGKIVETPPQMSFVNFPTVDSVVMPQTLHVEAESNLVELLKEMRPAFSIPPAKVDKDFDIPSGLIPPNPALHFHVLVRAPGGSGASFKVGLEAVNFAGRPLSNRGYGFAPVRAIDPTTQRQIGQTPRPNCGAPIRALVAYRMSDDPRSPFYNLYLSRPFALVTEKISAQKIADVKNLLDREILYSSSALRAFIDPSERNINSVVGPFAAEVDDQQKLIFPIATANAFTVDNSYIPGDNPPPPGGAVKMSGTYGTVCAQSGELRISATDMVLGSPRMPLEIMRSIGSQDTYEGPFGVGWDFNYNQRLTVLDPEVFPLGLQMPVIVRANKADSEIAGSQDVLLHTGMGSTVIFHWVDTNMPPEYAQDPLVSDFDYQTRVSDYYLPAKHQGVFDLLVKFNDGSFERLTPAGTRYRYNPSGKLDTIIDRFPLNHHDLEYDRDGLLVRIDSHFGSSGDHYVLFGYYRRASDPAYNATIDEVTDNSFLDGKIRRIRDYAGGEVQDQYDDEGFLKKRFGKSVAGENGGFFGRGQIQYLYKDCQIAGVAATAQGIPIFSTVAATSSSGKPVVQSGTGINGPVQIGVPVDNTAASLGGEKSDVTLGDGSTVQHTFDKWGNPTTASVSGPNGATAMTMSASDDNGLLMSLKHPEGNSETMVYDSDNPIFRSRGNLVTRTVDPGPRGGTGYSETFHYDPRYNLTSGDHTTPNGFTWTYTLRPDKREVSTIRYGAAGTETFSYNDNGQMTSHTDIRGVQTTFDYDLNTGFLQSRSLGDNEYTYHYGGDYASLLGRPSAIDLPEGAPMQFQYDRNLQEVEVKRGALVRRLGYNEQGYNIYQAKDLGDGKTLVTRSDYDATGFKTGTVVESVEVDGAPVSLEYRFKPDALSRVKSIHYPQGSERVFDYDNRGNVVRMTLGNYVEQHGIDLNNNVTSVRQGGDPVLEIVYDGLDRPVTITRKTGDADQVETRTYYPGGDLKSQTLSGSQFGEASKLTIDQLDEVGRAVRRSVSGTSIAPSYQYTYKAGSLVVDGPRMSTSRAWDTAGYTTGFTDPNLDATFDPDGNGRVMQVDRREDGAAYDTFHTYDNQDNRTSSSDNLGAMTFSHSRAEGSLLGLTNAIGHAIVFDQSVLGELLSQRREDGMQFDFHHDELRHVSYTGDPTAGFQLDYDGEFRLANSTLRDGSSITYSDFDPRQMPQKATIPGGTMTMAYDLQKRLTDKTVDYQSTTYEYHQSYDALSRVRLLTFKQDGGALNSIRYDYDEAGPLLSGSIQENGAVYLIKYTYYNDGSRKSVAYPSGVTVSETRDTTGRLTGLSDLRGNIIRVADWQGNRQPKTVLLGSDIQVANLYDPRGRLIASRATRISDGTVLTHARYLYDAANNLTNRQFLHRAGKADRFEYDAGERLNRAQIATVPLTPSGATVPLADRIYHYHASGLDYLTSAVSSDLTTNLPPFATNWTAHDAFLLPSVVDGFDRGNADPAGNVAQAQLRVRPASGGQPVPVPATLVHNGMGNLVRVTRSDGVVENNYFQPDGLRYRRQVSRDGTPVEDRQFVYDDMGRLLEEYDRIGATNRLVGRYYYGVSDAPDAADLLNPGSGTLQRYYFLKDNQQSVMAVADTNSVVLERAWYDPYGQPSIEQRDTAPPVVKRVIGGNNGSLLIALSESVYVPTNDPGPGTGIVRFPIQLTNLLSVTLLPTNGPPRTVQGSTDWAAGLQGLPPSSVVRFTSTQDLSGPLRISLNAGRLEDDWGNTNGAQTISLDATGGVGAVYYSAQPDVQTGPAQLARSSLGSPFLFHGQYFDYASGLIYLRARFYDPFSGMFFEPDPLGYENSVNLYAGLGNSPTTVRDPNGLGWWDKLKAALRFGRREAQGARYAEEVGQAAARSAEAEQTAMRVGEAGRIPDSFASATRAGVNQPLGDVVDVANAEQGAAAAAETEYASFYNSKAKHGTWEGGVGVTYKPGAAMAEATFIPGMKPFPGNRFTHLPEGTLTSSEIEELQGIANEYRTTFDVIGSRASGEGRNIYNPELPVGKGPGTRSDIDIRYSGQVDIGSRGAFSEALSGVGNGAGSPASAIGIEGTSGTYIRFTWGGRTPKIGFVP